MLTRLNPSHQATHQPGDTKAALSQSLLALLYMSQDALLLCVDIFLRVSLSLSISLCLFLHLSLTTTTTPPHAPFPTGDLFFCCGIWYPIHSECIVQLLSIAEDGPREAEWVTVGALVSPFSPSPPLLLATPLLAPCHTMMSWLLFAPGVPIDSLSVLHTLYLPLPPPYPP